MAFEKNHYVAYIRNTGIGLEVQNSGMTDEEERYLRN
jgi:hypothetical protein